MTLEEVVQTKQALEAEGVSPSLNQVLKRLGYGSKRDVQRLMAQLVPAPPPPEAAPPPRSAFGMALMGMDLPDRELPAVAPAPASLAWHQARVAATQAAMEAASAEELAFATRNTHLRQKLSACKKQLKHLLQCVARRMYAARCAGASASDERRAVEAERAAVEAEITRLQEAKEDLDAAYGEVAERKRQATAAWEQARDAAWQAARATRRREHR